MTSTTTTTSTRPPIPPPINNKKLELKMSHANQVLTCTALPTLGRNQSMFDAKNAVGMEDLNLDDSMNLNLALDLLRDDDDDDDDDVDEATHQHFQLHPNMIMSNISEKSNTSLLSNLSEKSGLSVSSRSLQNQQRGPAAAGEDMDDSSCRSSGSGSGLQDFLHARVSTFTKNMDTIAEIVTHKFVEEAEHNEKEMNKQRHGHP